MAVYDTRAPIASRPLDHVELGPGIGADLDRRLIGDVNGRRVLVLGCGAGHDAIGLALRGARVIAIDPEPLQLDTARQLATTHDVRVEFHQADLAELAFVRGDHIDLALSVAALGFVDDLDRVVRQVHRVVRPGGHFLLATPHAAGLCTDPADLRRVARPWDAEGPIDGRWPHRTDDVVMSLLRADLAVDALFERTSPNGGPMPTTLIVRARAL